MSKPKQAEDEQHAPYNRDEFKRPVDEVEASKPEKAPVPTEDDPLLEVQGAEARRRSKAKKLLAFKKISSTGKKK